MKNSKLMSVVKYLSMVVMGVVLVFGLSMASTIISKADSPSNAWCRLDTETDGKVLYIFGNVTNIVNTNNGGIELPIGVEKKDVDFIRVENSATLPESCRFLFEGFSNVKSINLTNANSDNVTDMSYMFDSCTNLKGIIFSNSFNTSKVKDMTGMFLYCTSLTTLDLTTFTVSQITDDTSKDENHMMDMFQYCSNLESIIVNQSWQLDKSVVGLDMFDGCYKLVGGNGTFFDSSNKNSAYARIDTSDYPGYLSTANNLLVYGQLNTDGSRFKLIISFENIYSGNNDYTVKYGDTLETVHLQYHDSDAQVEISVPAKEMNTAKALVITYGENTLFNKNISVADYLRRLNTYASTDDALYAITGLMLRYGASAIKYFYPDTANSSLPNYNIDNYNSFIFTPSFEDEGLTTTNTTINPANINSAIGDFSYAGISISLDGELNFMMAFKLPDGVSVSDWNDYSDRSNFEATVKSYITESFKEKTTFRLDGTGKYVLAVTEVNVKNLDSAIYSSTGFGNNISATTYLYRNYNSTSSTEGLKNVCKSLYTFHRAAKTYSN